MRRALAILVGVMDTAGGCGRVAFDPTGDAISPDSDSASSDARPPLCDAFTDAIWCNDFETGDLLGAENRAAGVFVAGGGNAGSDGFSFTSAPDETRRLRIVLPSIVTSGSLHVGGYMFLDAPTAPVSYVVLAQAVAASFTTKISFDFNATDRLQITNTIDGGAVQDSIGSFPRQRWFCFELAIVVADTGGGGNVDLDIDGIGVLSGWTNQATMPQDGFFAIEVGAISSSANVAPVTVRLDDLIVHTSAIGCR